MSTVEQHLRDLELNQLRERNAYLSTSCVELEHKRRALEHRADKLATELELVRMAAGCHTVARIVPHIRELRRRLAKPRRQRKVAWQAWH